MVLTSQPASQTGTVNCDLSLLESLQEDVSGDTELEHALAMQAGDLGAGLGSCS